MELEFIREIKEYRQHLGKALACRENATRSLEKIIPSGLGRVCDVEYFENSVKIKTGGVSSISISDVNAFAREIKVSTEDIHIKTIPAYQLPLGVHDGGCEIIVVFDKSGE
jgi:hypothetical protein